MVSEIPTHVTHSVPVENGFTFDHNLEIELLQNRSEIQEVDHAEMDSSEGSQVDVADGKVFYLFFIALISLNKISSIQDWVACSVLNY